ncbi:hypothetical protein LZ32DRAFT_8361 [Colletotrichum eremochloae]|nr:hypothetical protein LZ32DRAFT_8361 [Colletotrichum eremochloae]
MDGTMTQPRIGNIPLNVRGLQRIKLRDLQKWRTRGKEGEWGEVKSLADTLEGFHKITSRERTRPHQLDRHLLAMNGGAGRGNGIGTQREGGCCCSGDPPPVTYAGLVPADTLLTRCENDDWVVIRGTRIPVHTAHPPLLFRLPRNLLCKSCGLQWDPAAKGGSRNSVPQLCSSFLAGMEP